MFLTRKIELCVLAWSSWTQVKQGGALAKLEAQHVAHDVQAGRFVARPARRRERTAHEEAPVQRFVRDLDDLIFGDELHLVLADDSAAAHDGETDAAFRTRAGDAVTRRKAHLRQRY